MFGHDYFSTSHFVRQTGCSPRSAQRFLRSYCKVAPGHHVRLTKNELEAAVLAYHEEQTKPREIKDIWEIRKMWRLFLQIRNNPQALREFADEVERSRALAPC